VCVNKYKNKAMHAWSCPTYAGIVEPVRLNRAVGMLGLGKGKEYDSMASDATACRKALEVVCGPALFLFCLSVSLTSLAFP